MPDPDQQRIEDERQDAIDDALEAWQEAREALKAREADFLAACLKKNAADVARERARDDERALWATYEGLMRS